MKIAILGSTSFVGNLVKKHFSKDEEKNEIIEFSRANGNLNLTADFDYEHFVDELISVQPEVIINCVGIGDIKSYDETSRAKIELDFRINSEFPSIIFLNSKKINSLKFALNFSSVSVDLPSPLFSSYSSSKAYISKMIETINAENTVTKTDLVITDAHLFNFKNSKNFSGGNDVSSSEDEKRVAECIKAMFEKKTKFFEDQFDGVVVKQRINFNKFIDESFKNKIERSEVIAKRERVGYLTGSFDAMHFGHINLIRRAASQCDRLVIGIHRDGNRKGVEFVHSLEQRINNLKSMRFVCDVIVTSGDDDLDWNIVKYNTLFVGTDYMGTERFKRYEKSLNGKAKIVYLPRTEGVSSTQLRERHFK